MKTDLQRMRDDAAAFLAELERRYTLGGHKLTLVARSTKEPDADVIISNDDDLRAVSTVLIDHVQRGQDEQRRGRQGG